MRASGGEDSGYFTRGLSSIGEDLVYKPWASGGRIGALSAHAEMNQQEIGDKLYGQGRELADRSRALSLGRLGQLGEVTKWKDEGPLYTQGRVTLGRAIGSQSRYMDARNSELFVNAKNEKMNIGDLTNSLYKSRQVDDPMIERLITRAKAEQARVGKVRPDFSVGVSDFYHPGVILGEMSTGNTETMTDGRDWSMQH